MTQSVLRLVGKEDGDKQRALEAALAQIDRAFGKGSVMKLGDKGKIVEIESVSTGSLGPRHGAGHRRPAQGPDRRDLRAGKLGQDHARPARGGRGAEGRRHRRLHRRRACARSRPTPTSWGSTSTTCWSPSPTPASRRWRSPTPWCAPARWTSSSSTRVAALTPRAEIEGEMGDSLPGLQARLMSQALRKLTASISKTKTLVIFINQIRMKIGVMYGSPETTTGGNALKFYASVRLDIRRTGSVKRARRDHRQQRPGQGGQEQGRPAVPRGRVRHHVRRRASPSWARSSTSASRPG